MKQYAYKMIMILTMLLAIHTFAVAQTSITNSTADFSAFSTSIVAALGDIDIRQQGRVPLVVREKVFKNFCTVMSSIGEANKIPLYYNADTKLYYNPKHSAFVHIVCAPYGFKSSFGKVNPQEKTYFLKDDWVTLRIHGKEMKNPKMQDNKCRPDFGMTDCDVAKEFTDIMHRILDDMFNIKQSQMYGGTSQADDPKERFNTFTQNYFVGLQLCPDKKCDYPKTENRLLAYFKKAEWLLKKLDIINWAYINKQLKERENIDVNCSFPRNDTYNLLLCGFGAQEASSLEPFIAMVENEIFFYRLLMAQYMWWMTAERRLLGDEYTELSRSTEKTADIVAKTQQHIAWTQDAVDMSMRSLREMAATFPIHIGLLIYYEDLYRLRKELVKMVTPLYTLSDKLRNVQKKD